MRKRITKLWGNTLLRGTSIFFVGSMITNFASFVYHLLISRILGPVEYGILSSLLGLTYFVGIPTTAIDTVITKTVSEFPDSNRQEKSKALLLYLYRKYFKLFILSLVLAGIISWPIKQYLNLESVLSVLLVWVIVYLLFVGTILTSVLKGLLSFIPIFVNQTLTIVLRVGLSSFIVLFLISNHLGAQLGVIIAAIFGLVLLFWQLRGTLSAKLLNPRPNFSLRNLGLSSFFLSAVFTSMYSLDIILVKHYLSPHDAGLYAVLATAGKIVLFAVSPLMIAVLPVVARKSSTPSQARGDLVLTVTLSLLVGTAAVGLYFLFPRQIISLVFTDKFVGAVPYLARIGLVMLFFSLANALSSFLFSLGRTNVYLIGAAALLFEILLITLFHTSLSDILTILTTVFGILAGSLTIYSFNVTKKT